MMNQPIALQTAMRIVVTTMLVGRRTRVTLAWALARVTVTGHLTAAVVGVMAILRQQSSNDLPGDCFNSLENALNIHDEYPVQFAYVCQV